MLSNFTSLLSSVSSQLKYSPALIHQKRSNIASNALFQDHETSRALNELITRDGAGSWPPNVSYKEHWPVALHPYHDICMEMAPLVTTEDVSLDDETNKTKRAAYRTMMEEHVTTRIDLGAVEACLAEDDLTPAAWNGLFGCLSILRHCYRWATVPAVKVAQDELYILFPAELQTPWDFLQNRYGISSQGGSVTSVFICNTTEDGRVVYSICSQRSEYIRKTEANFAPLFRQTEEQGLPLYRHMIDSIIHFEQGDRVECIKSMKALNQQLRLLLKVFYDTLIDKNVPHAAWLRYIQSFVGWAAGENKEGKYVEYGGLCAGQLPCFLFLDAFADICPHLSAESMLHNVPHSHRELRSSIKRHCFRRMAEMNGDVEIVAEFENILKQMRVFRQAHRVRIHPYLKAPAPERRPFFAGRGVVESEKVIDANGTVAIADQVLLGRVAATV